MMGPFIVPVSFIVAIAAVLILRGPLGTALADRIAGRVGHGQSGDRELEELRAEVDGLRNRLTEAEERLDFTERLLARRQEPERLPGQARAAGEP